MKYFTVEWYERMQAWGPMMLPDDEADLREYKEYSRQNGGDYDEEQITLFRMELPQLRKYVPEHLLELMDGGRLKCSVPPPEKADPIREWLQTEMKRSEEVGRAYSEHFSKIEPLLPPGVRDLLFNYPLHDARITAVLQIGEPGEVHALMDYRGALGFIGWCTLVFTGVQEWIMPEDPVYSSWLYDEIYIPAPGTFELRGLIYPRMGPNVQEIRIVAENVRIEDIRQMEGHWEPAGGADPGADSILRENVKEWDEELGRQSETETERFRED